MHSGYIYVLVNISLPGVVKVGESTELPSRIAHQLASVSCPTTPFIVAYEHYFDDCHAVYMNLKQQLQIPENQEFFHAAVSDVVSVIATTNPNRPRVQCDAMDGDQLFTPDEGDFKFFRLEDRRRPWDRLMEEGNNQYYALDAHHRDYLKAIKLYRAAADLGCGKACLRLGEIYIYGQGVPVDYEKGLECLKEGVSKGDYVCYREMAMLFLWMPDVEKARQAFAQFVSSGEADEWISCTDFPQHHIALLFGPLNRSALELSHVDPYFILLTRKYASALVEFGRKELLKPGIHPLHTVSLLKVIGTLEGLSAGRSMEA